MAFQPAWLLYGATGFTGRLIVECARKAGMNPILGGRDETKLKQLADATGCKYRVFGVDNRADVDRALSGVRLLLNCAGPFGITTAPLASGCLLNSVHYLDIAGEVADFRALHRMHERADDGGVMLLPGVGFGVLPTDCLALHVFKRRPRTAIMKIGYCSDGGASRGTLRTLLACLQVPGVARERGELVPARAAASSWQVDLGAGGKRTLVSNPWRGDLFSAGLSTGLPHIETYFEVPWLVRSLLGKPELVRDGLGASMARKAVSMAAEGPSAAKRAKASSYCIVEAVDEDGRRASSVLRGPEAYELTAQTAVYAVGKALSGTVRTGFVTPAQLFGTAPLTEIKSWTLVDS